MKKLTASTPRRNHTNGHSNGHTPTNRVAPRLAATTPSAKPSGELAELRTQLAILARSQAVAEFAPDGTLLAANENYLALFGYAPTELTGQPHRK